MPAAAHVSRLTPTQVLMRLVVGLGGAYAFTHGAFALLTAGASRLGMHYDDAWMLAAMTAFPLLLGAVLWAFAARDLRRTALILFAGAAVMLGLALVLAGPAGGSTSMYPNG